VATWRGWQRGSRHGCGGGSGSRAERGGFLAEATSGEYDHALGAVMKYLDVE